MPCIGDERTSELCTVWCPCYKDSMNTSLEAYSIKDADWLLTLTSQPQRDVSWLNLAYIPRLLNALQTLIPRNRHCCRIFIFFVSIQLLSANDKPTRTDLMTTDARHVRELLWRQTAGGSGSFHFFEILRTQLHCVTVTLWFMIYNCE